MTKKRKRKVAPTVFGESDKAAKQSFKTQCDINSIIDKAMRTGVLSHVNKHAEFYADMTDFDYEEAQNEIARTNSAFYELPAELRSEFNNNPGAFRTYVSQATPEEIVKRLPELAEPGRQNVDVVHGLTNPAVQGEVTPSSPEAATPPETGDVQAPDASE